MKAQTVENTALRACAGLTSAQTGLMVKGVHPMCPLPKGTLIKGDVLTHFDGVALANDGTVPFRRGERCRSLGIGSLGVGSALALALALR